MIQFLVNIPKSLVSNQIMFFNKYKRIWGGCDTISEARQDTLDNYLKLCNLPMMYAEPIDSNPCVRDLYRMAYENALIRYKSTQDSLVNNFNDGYVRRCLQAVSHETFTATYHQKEYHFTLYYYDQANNLVRTVPPKGVHRIQNADSLTAIKAHRSNSVNPSKVPLHSMFTSYKYNTLNQLTWQQTPDGGISEYWYDRLGRLTVSQSARQKAENAYLYSYTIYDEVGRIQEVGQMSQASSMTESKARDSVQLISWLASTSRAQITNTFYDNAINETIDDQFGSTEQENLRNRVSAITYKETHTADYSYASFYSYDIHGNVAHMVHDYEGLENLKQRYFHLEYEYDLISGNVRELTYQRDKKDQLIHQYVYDADNRLLSAHISKDDLIYEEDAHYFYYRHGPLARVEIGGLKIQGMDYAYNLHGWIKGVNSNTLNTARDMGQDGLHQTGNIHETLAPDEFGFTLGYYAGDYLDIGENSTSDHFEASLSGSTYSSGSASLFNGNIRQMVTAIRKFMSGAAPEPVGYAYRYDQLNRLKTVNAYNNINLSNNTWNSSGAEMVAYHNRFTYDDNGNILSQVRRGATPYALDSLTYQYSAGRNRLNYVDDVVASANYDDDIDDQKAGNYQYDATGNLTADAAEEIKKIEWTVYGKVKSITRKTGSSKANLEFQYGPDGQRVMKKSTVGGSTNTQYYVRDAAGNVMATYELTAPFIDLDSSYLTLMNKLIELKGIDSLAQFISETYASNDTFYNPLGDHIADTSLVQGDLCLDNNIYRHLFSCCETCSRSSTKALMIKMLQIEKNNHSTDIIKKLLSCNPELTLMAFLNEDALGFLNDFADADIDIIYNHFIGTFPQNTTITKRAYLKNEVPKIQLIFYLLNEFPADLSVTYDELIDQLELIVAIEDDEPWSAIEAWFPPCKFLQCVTDLANVDISVTQEIYNTLINAYDPSPTFSDWKTVYNGLDTTLIPADTIIACDPAHFIYAAINQYGDNILDHFNSNTFSDLISYTNHFLNLYPVSPVPSNYAARESYLLTEVPVLELAEYIVSLEASNGNLQNLIAELMDYYADELSSSFFSAEYEECVFRNCIVNSTWFPQTADSLSMIEYLKRELGDYMIAAKQSCSAASFTDYFGKSITEQWSYTLLNSCEPDLVTSAFREYNYSSLLRDLLLDNTREDLIKELYHCDSIKLLDAFLSYNYGRTVAAIKAGNSTLITNACSTLQISFPNPNSLACDQYLQLIVPVKDFRDYIISNTYDFTDDLVAEFTNTEFIAAIHDFYTECDFKSCMQTRFLATGVVLDHDSLLTVMRSRFWPGMVREIYACNRDSFTRAAVNTNLNFVAGVFENWHLPLYRFMMAVDDYYGSGLMDTLNTDTFPEYHYLKLNQHDLYGSSRLGIWLSTDTTAGSVKNVVYTLGDHSKDAELDTAKVQLSAWNEHYSLKRGKKRFELTNHLGNVMVVISDKKIVNCDSSYLQYAADVWQAQDYYAFGAVMDDRKWALDSVYVNADTTISCDTLRNVIIDYVSVYGNSALTDSAQLKSYFDNRLHLTLDVSTYFNGLRNCELISDSLYFDGTSSYADFGNQTQYRMDTNNFTIEAWVNLNHNGDHTILSSLRFYNTSRYSGFLLTTGDRLIGFNVYDGSFTSGSHGRVTIISGDRISLNEWHHIVVQRIGNNGSDFKLYIDGISKTFSVAANTLVTGNLETEGSHNVTIGRITGNAGSDPFKGSLKEVRMYKRILSAEEIASNYNNGCSPEILDATDLVLHAPLDEGTGTGVYDHSSYHVSGSIVNSGYSWHRNINYENCGAGKIGIYVKRSVKVPVSYAYLYNGKESNEEVSGTGNLYDYGFRIYNPRLGIFLSIDPVSRIVPWWTPYQYAGNTPIWAMDFDGLQPVVRTTSLNGITYTFTFKNRRSTQSFTISSEGNESTEFSFNSDESKKPHLKLFRTKRSQEDPYTGPDIIKKDDYGRDYVHEKSQSSADNDKLNNAVHGNVSVLLLVEALLEQNSDIQLLVIGNHQIPKSKEKGGGAIYTTGDKVFATEQQRSREIDIQFTLQRAEYVKAKYFHNSNRVTAVSRANISRFRNFWIPMGTFGRVSFGVTIGFKLRKKTPTPTRIYRTPRYL